MALVVTLTGPRAMWLDRHGSRSDVIVVAAILAAFAVIHWLAFQRLVPRILRMSEPPAYDEHRVLFDLGHEARMARDVGQLYGLVVRRIGEVLQAESVSILVYDEPAGVYRTRVSTRPDATGSGFELGREAFVIRRLRGLATPLPVSRADIETWGRALAEAPAEVRDARSAECAALERSGTRLLVQIRTRDQLVGLLVLGERAGRHGYTDADREMLFLAAAQLALIIENEKMLDRAVAEERLRQELALASEVQQRLLPDRAPIVAGIDLAGVCIPARGVGGDYYDFIELADGGIGIAVADVSGKGISAALVMSSVQAYLRGQTVATVAGATRDGNLADLVAKINLLLCRSTGLATYVTFFYGEFDGSSRRLSYVNAGHNPPILLRDGAAGASAPSVVRLGTGGPVFGVFETPGYEQDVVELPSGSILVAFTDGVTEALDLAGEEFGEDRLIETVRAVADLSGEAIREAVLRRIEEWSAGTPQHDDLTLVIAKAT